MENEKETSAKKENVSQEEELKRLSDFFSLLMQIDKRINEKETLEKQDD